MRRVDDTLRIEVIMIGSTAVGKTSLAVRYSNDAFDPDSVMSTLGADYFSGSTRTNDNGLRYSIAIADTAGQEKYMSLTLGQLRNKHAIILAFSCDDPDSFKAIPKWLDLVDNKTGDTPIFLVCTKTDLEWKFPKEDVDNLINSLDSPFSGYMETSAKTGEGVNVLFEMISMNDDVIAATKRHIDAVIVSE